MTQEKSMKLYIYRSNTDLFLEQVVSNCDDLFKEAIALFYSPTTCRLLRLVDGEFKDSDDKTFNRFADVFEGRIFNKNHELRWLNRDRGKGEVVLLSESKLALNTNDWNVLDEINCEPLDQKYLIWGQKTKNQPSQNNWQRLAEARIGKLDIPIDKELEEQERVYLITREYITEWIDNNSNSKSYGNFSVIEERLIKLEAQ